MREIARVKEMSQALSVSRSYQYRKVMKPLLERKRRARINRCLEELKQLIVQLVHLVGTAQSTTIETIVLTACVLLQDEETLAKLEKADILELTVHQLHKQRREREWEPANSSTPEQFEYFWNGFQQCLLEVSQSLQRNNIQLTERFFEAMRQLMPPRPVSYWRPW